MRVRVRLGCGEKQRDSWCWWLGEWASYRWMCQILVAGGGGGGFNPHSWFNGSVASSAINQLLSWRTCGSSLKPINSETRWDLNGLIYSVTEGQWDREQWASCRQSKAVELFCATDHRSCLADWEVDNLSEWNPLCRCNLCGCLKS